REPEALAGQLAARWPGGWPGRPSRHALPAAASACQTGRTSGDLANGPTRPASLGLHRGQDRPRSGWVWQVFREGGTSVSPLPRVQGRGVGGEGALSEAGVWRPLLQPVRCLLTPKETLKTGRPARNERAETNFIAASA